MTVRGDTRVAAVMGFPVEHSRSPLIHAHWLARYEINGAMIPLEVAPQDLAPVLSLFDKTGLVGASVTLPHKEAVFGLVTPFDAATRAVGAVNMITVDDSGALVGRNTDGFGFLENVKSACPEWEIGRGHTVVLGAGGAARAVVHALALAGAPEIRLANRTKKRAAKVAKDLAGVTESKIRVGGWSERETLLANAAAVVNTTSLGMTGQPALDLDLDALPPSAMVCDIVYTPLETPLLARARARGNPVVDGLGMLIHQARPAFREWFGVDPDVTDDLRGAVIQDLETKRD